jgi:hypothetical protein
MALYIQYEKESDIMIRMFCDRCDSEIHSNGYNIEIKEDCGVNTLYNYLSCGNVTTSSINAALNAKEIYCEDCINKIKRYIKEKPIKSSFFKG